MSFWLHYDFLFYLGYICRPKLYSMCSRNIYIISLKFRLAIALNRGKIHRKILVWQSGSRWLELIVKNCFARRQMKMTFNLRISREEGKHRAESERGEGSIAEAAAASFVPSECVLFVRSPRIRFCPRRLHWIADSRGQMDTSMDELAVACCDSKKTSRDPGNLPILRENRSRVYIPVTSIPRILGF